MAAENKKRRKKDFPPPENKRVIRCTSRVRLRGERKCVVLMLRAVENHPYLASFNSREYKIAVLCAYEYLRASEYLNDGSSPPKISRLNFRFLIMAALSRRLRVCLIAGFYVDRSNWDGDWRFVIRLEMFWIFLELFVGFFSTVEFSVHVRSVY